MPNTKCLPDDDCISLSSWSEWLSDKFVDVLVLSMAVFVWLVGFFAGAMISHLF